MGVKDEKFQYYGDSLKNPIFRDGVHKNPIYRGELPQRGREGGVTVCRFKGKGLGEKEVVGVVFLRMVDTSMHTMFIAPPFKYHLNNFI